jgi:hypothetical protein
MFGLPVLATEWRALVARPSAPAVRRLHERAELLRDRGACRFPDGIAGFVGSAARVFRDELEHHAAGRCTARDAVTPGPCTPGRTDAYVH